MQDPTPRSRDLRLVPGRQRMPTLAEEDMLYRAHAASWRAELAPPAASPCTTCPWRTRYHDGEPNPKFRDCRAAVTEAWHADTPSYGLFGAKHGLLICCHRSNSEYRSGQEYDKLSTCAAAISIQQREAIRWHENEPSGIDEATAVRMGERMGIAPDLFRARKLTRADLVASAHPAISDPSIGHPELPPMRPGEFDGEPLTAFLIELDADVTPTARARIETDPCCQVESDRSVAVAASSRDAAIARVAHHVAGNEDRSSR